MRTDWDEWRYSAHCGFDKMQKQHIYEVDEVCHIEEILWRQLTSL